MKNIVRLICPVLTAALLTSGSRAWAQCFIAYQLDAGSGSINPALGQMQFSVGGFAGSSGNAAFTQHAGYRQVASANFNACYLNSGFPLSVQVASDSWSGSLLVKSAAPNMTLSWTSGINQVPVQYNVYFGNSPNQLSLLGTTAGQSWPIQNLAYAQNYYWKIDTFDTFGRHTSSAATFSFSLAPDPISSMYCAPNPFRAGAQTTTFIFTMQGAGSAEMKIYILPHADLVYSTHWDRLTDGPNLWIYDGRDNHGQVLFNGVYLAVLNTHGTSQSGIQKFKFIVAK